MSLTLYKLVRANYREWVREVPEVTRGVATPALLYEVGSTVIHPDAGVGMRGGLGRCSTSIWHLVYWSTFLLYGANRILEVEVDEGNVLSSRTLGRPLPVGDVTEYLVSALTVVSVPSNSEDTMRAALPAGVWEWECMRPFFATS